jgi:hypothetical protein
VVRKEEKRPESGGFDPYLLQ